LPEATLDLPVHCQLEFDRNRTVSNAQASESHPSKDYYQGLASEQHYSWANFWDGFIRAVQ
jgi:hypothetical protein